MVIVISTSKVHRNVGERILTRAQICLSNCKRMLIISREKFPSSDQKKPDNDANSEITAFSRSITIRCFLQVVNTAGTHYCVCTET